MIIPELHTERLKLRAFQAHDLGPYYAMCSNAEVMRYIGNSAVMQSRAEVWRHMAMILGHWQLRGYGLWAVEEQASGKMIGRIGFFNPEGWPGFELGWMLAREYWKKGLASEGASKALQYAFDELAMPQVISIIHPDNNASIQVAKRLGQQFLRYDQVKEIDVHIYGIDRYTA